jgi:transposase
VFLPAYAPTLNPVERLWKFFEEKALNDRYLETFTELKAACEALLADPARHRRKLVSLLAENLEIVG